MAALLARSRISRHNKPPLASPSLFLETLPHSHPDLIDQHGNHLPPQCSSSPRSLSSPPPPPPRASPARRPSSTATSSPSRKPPSPLYFPNSNSPLTPTSSDDDRFDGTAVSLKDNTAGIYDAQPDSLVIDVQDGLVENASLAAGDDGFLSLEGAGGLQDLVLVDQVAEDGGFTIEPKEGGEEEGLINVTWGGKGEWLVESVGENDFQLKWSDGELVPLRSLYVWLLLTLYRRGCPH